MFDFVFDVPANFQCRWNGRGFKGSFFYFCTCQLSNGLYIYPLSAWSYIVSKAQCFYLSLIVFSYELNRLFYWDSGLSTEFSCKPVISAEFTWKKNSVCWIFISEKVWWCICLIMGVFRGFPGFTPPQLNSFLLW